MDSGSVEYKCERGCDAAFPTVGQLVIHETLEHDNTEDSDGNKVIGLAPIEGGSAAWSYFGRSM